MKCYRVGGAVRDRLLGRPVKDTDWVVVGATPGDMLAQGYKAVGKERTVETLDTLNRLTGRAVRWLALAMVLVQFAIVVLRYVYGVSSIALNESVLYMHAALFMLGAGYTHNIVKPCGREVWASVP